MLIVADSSALIALAVCDGLDILQRVYDEVRVPKAVYNEVALQEKPQAAVLAGFLLGKVIEVDISDWVLTAGGLGQGEIEAMSLYKQISADALLVDDHRARLIAEHNHIHCIGALGILLLAKRNGQIEKIEPFVQKLRLSPMRYGDALLNKVLKLAGE